MHSASEIVGAARQLAGEMETERQEIRALRDENREAVTDATRCRDEIGQQLTAILLPELTRPALEHLTALIGSTLPGNKNPIAAREAERRRCTEALARLQADPRYPDGRERLERLQAELAAAAMNLEPQLDILKRATHPRLERLLQNGYETPRYAVKWWEIEFYDDWKAGDEIVEQFPGHDGFDTVRELVLRARDRTEAGRRQIARLEGEAAPLRDLFREVDGLQRSLDTLDETHLTAARQRLQTWLLGVDQAALAGALAGRPDLIEMLKTFWGHAAKVTYLQHIGAQLDEALEQCETARIRALRDAEKYQRPKRSSERLSETDFERRYRQATPRLRRRRERFRHMNHAIRGYDRYDQVDMTTHFLWWDLFTDGQFDGEFIPEVSAFYRDHPDRRRARQPLDDSQAAAVEAGLLHGQVDDRLLGDAS